MARHCDFTGGDGEGDLYVRTLTVLDREGRFAVEGGVVHAADFYETRLLRVDCDGVGVGVGIGGYLRSAYRVGRFIFGKRCLIQFPFFHLVFAKGFRRDAGGQGILDRAGAQAGDDGIRDGCKGFVQGICIRGVVSKRFLRPRLRLCSDFLLQIIANSYLLITVFVIIFYLITACTKANRIDRCTVSQRGCCDFGGIIGILFAIFSRAMDIVCCIANLYRPFYADTFAQVKCRFAVR